MGTGIEWTQETINPIIGCSKCSPGCQNCYAEKMAVRLAANPATAANYSRVITGGKWNGKTAFVESALEKPLRWKKPRKIFVGSMGDLFHESVPFEWIDRIFVIASVTPQHTYQLLTKRPERMLVYFKVAKERLRDTTVVQWPLPNVWIGVTVEDQTHTFRLDYLSLIPAAVRFVSYEPALSRVFFAPWMDKISWVICGGESGPGARPMDPDWARRVRDDCKRAGVPFFFKQMSGGVAIPDDLMIREFPPLAGKEGGR